MLGASLEKLPDYSRDKRRERSSAETSAGPALPGLAALTALMLLCSVLVAKTLAYMVERVEVRQSVDVAQALPPQTPDPSHRRALSDRFLRKGIDEVATGSVHRHPER